MLLSVIQGSLAETAVLVDLDLLDLGDLTAVLAELDSLDVLEAKEPLVSTIIVRYRLR